MINRTVQRNNGQRRRALVIDFRPNQKRVCDFLFVRHSNLGSILHRFRDIAGFLRSRVTPPIFNPNFAGVPVAPDRPCWDQPAHEHSAIQLFGREIIFEEFQPV